jgi:hypothetical protein
MGKGNYRGGDTLIDRRNSDWFTKGSTEVPRAESAPRPERTLKEQAEYEALKRKRETESRLIKADDQLVRRKKARHKPKKKLKSPKYWRSP